MLSQDEVEATVLRRLYEANFRENGGYNLHTVCQETGWESGRFWKVVDRMSHENLVKAWTQGGAHKITTDGLLLAEENRLVPDNLRTENLRIRTAILEFLAIDHDAAASPYASTPIQTLSEQAGVDMIQILTNLRALSDLGFTEYAGMNSAKITYSGLDEIADWHKRRGFASEFEQISQMGPQPRGRALQKLLARVVEESGWLQEEGARTSHEEMDVVLHRDREYYLAECKWEKEPIEAAVVRELFGKLGNRIGVQGLIMSMSGFSSGCVQQAEDYAGAKVILLFGPTDIQAVVRASESFDSLLNHKYRELITRREAVWE